MAAEEVAEVTGLSLAQINQIHDLAKFSNSQRKDKGLARALRAPNPYPCVKLAKSYQIGGSR